MSDLFGEDLFDVFSSDTSTSRKRPRKKEKEKSEKYKAEIQSPESPDQSAETEENANDKDLSKQPIVIKDEEEVEEIEIDDEDKQSKKLKLEDEEDKKNINQAVKIADEIIKMEEDEDEFAPKKEKILEDLESLQKFLPSVEVKTLETPEGSGCTHQVALPKDYTLIPLVPIENPVKTYKFKLDLFQELAITCVDNYQSVLVSAHTSAGKTVVAEYAIAKGLKDNQRIIYTTPIKALSNQKYREFYEEFKDVGLITGDVTINPSASCLIMTTEILRNMLYRGSEIMREVGWVVFDEIHYMRDKERGVVWEETIILLPSRTHYVFLSATIPNASQFAQWITHLHKQPCNVIFTDYRPVPLYHYLYAANGEGIHLVVDDKGNFKEEGFNKAISLITEVPGGKKPNPRQAATPVGNVINMAMQNQLAPVIAFSFSKKECEIYAIQLAKCNYNDEDEKGLVEEVFNNAIDVLSKDDQKLPQVINLLPLLKQGVGIHHGGLLPILKETVELLFSEGLIKVLFATETFAMGLNMPAKTVLFTNVRKFDGNLFRWITSGEYIQMSGRAGRRGIDEKGYTIVMIDEKISPSIGRALFKGQADPINSAFHLTYNMVLNLMRVEEVNPEYMMEKSFYQFQNYSTIPAVCEKLKKAEEDYTSLVVPREKDVAIYYNLRNQLSNFGKEFRRFITKPKYILPFLQQGRMIYVKSGDLDFGWGTVVDYKKADQSKENPAKAPTNMEYIVGALLHVSLSTSFSKSTSDLKPAMHGEKNEMKLVPISLDIIDKISQVRLYFSNDLRPVSNRTAVLKSIDDVHKRFPNGVPLLDPIKDMNIKDKNFDDLIQKIQQFESRLNAHPLHNDRDIKYLYNVYEKKLQLRENVQNAKKELKGAKSLLQMDELKCRKRVLRRLGYSSGEDVIEVKGRVACELSSADELLLTEMLFNGMFIDLDAPKAVALLSCLVCDERSSELPKLSEDLSGPLKMMQDMARHIAKVSKESKLELDEDEYVDQFKPFLMDVVHEWCKGASFSKLCEMTDIFEGGIIRCMRRLEELLRQMSLAAKVIGNKELENKFNEGVKLIKRDIVFAASLYL